MKLLDPNEIKEEKKESAIQSQKLIENLSIEEARINKELNLLKEESKQQKKTIKLETDAYITEQTERRDILDREVVSLESRRIEALKPLDNTKKELEQSNFALKQGVDALEVEKVKIDTKHEENLDLAEKLNDKEAELGDREAKIISRENKVVSEESRVKDSINTLSDQWVKFHDAVNKNSIVFAEKSSIIKSTEKTLDIRSEKLTHWEVQLNNRDREIRDKYATLERTIKRIKK